MKRLIPLILLFLAALSPSNLIAGGGVPDENEHRFRHGPYLQGVGYHQAHVYFTTTGKGFSYVQLCECDSETVKDYYATDNGLIEAYNTLNAIRLGELKPATRYRYRLVSKQMTGFEPYKITYGQSISSQWYEFETLDPAAESCSFVVMSDIHDKADQYRKLLSFMPLDSVQAVFLVGDIMSHFSRESQPYSSFIDVSVEEFATGKQFALVRGNHETRGHLARTYGDYVYRPGGNYYGTLSFGDTFIIMLDSGEDKPDSHPVYAGINCFDLYRAEQAQWLAGVVETESFKSAARRIVMVHIPPMVPQIDAGDHNGESHGSRHVAELFLPILNDAGIDLMISGHLHRRFIVEPQEGIINFPLIINDNKSASYINCTPEGIYVRTVNADGEVTFERTF